MDQIKTKIDNDCLLIDLYRTAKETKKLVILLPGIPYKPKRYDLTDQLNGLGFDVAFTHYIGTWGSEGEFLAQPPQKEIDLLINKIRDEGLNNILYTEVFLIGTSFGGAVVLNINDDPIIKKVIALSPVISYKKTLGIDSLSGYLTSNFPNEYNFKTERFADLINDKISSPTNGFRIDPNKVIMLGGKEDEEINIKDIESFGEQNKIKHFSFDTGHITFSKITDEILKVIIGFLE